VLVLVVSVSKGEVKLLLDGDDGDNDDDSVVAGFDTTSLARVVRIISMD